MEKVLKKQLKTMNPEIKKRLESKAKTDPNKGARGEKNTLVSSNFKWISTLVRSRNAGKD